MLTCFFASPPTHPSRGLSSINPIKQRTRGTLDATRLCQKGGKVKIYEKNPVILVCNHHSNNSLPANRTNVASRSNRISICHFINKHIGGVSANRNYHPYPNN